MPHPSCPLSQAPSPPANPTAARLTVSDVETLLNPQYSITGMMTLANWSLDSQENRAIMDAVRNRGIAPAVAIANAEASAIAKGNVKGPSGHSTGIGAAPPAVNTLPSIPPTREPSPAPALPIPSPPRAPSPSALVLSSKWPLSLGSSSSGHSVAVASVCDSEDSSMALDYEAVTPRPGSPAKPVDNKPIVRNLHETIDNTFDIIALFAKTNWKEHLLKETPTLMDDDLIDLHKHFLHNMRVLAPRIRANLPAVEAPASAADAPAPHVIPRDAQPPADSTKSKPPKKKVRVEPASSDVTPPAMAPLMEVDEPAAPQPASGKAPAKPFPIPSSKRASTPKDAPPGKHTAHGASRHGIILTPPAGSPVTAESFSPGVLNGLNQVLRSDVKSNITLTHATVDGNGIFLAASRVPTAAEIQFVLKHIVDIPHVPTSPKEWAAKQHEAFIYALNKSPVSTELAKLIKHKPRFMRASPHSDSCWAWIDIHDTVSGSNARDYISKFISVRGVNCQIKGAKPHSGSVRCARCQRWGHHSDQCRAKCARCSLCGGPHSEANHSKCVDASRVDVRHCVNCTAAKRPADKRAHSATDTSCPFWRNRFDRLWLKRQFPKN
ncbi:hypothetical protein AGABI2DRAFT_119199 [Agaricus bisporus var. bisporus H97]|uniref:hypothetical protein n=1 Tax=Agaricus bisporus var. bisporus (strain H97 / ATCC MYA-4626 / FGSC 10389) TaxID=936046 RepID=UPI00029F7EAE|nr:hypothetical protein AGABI2DRAFT_119199 [Agaricus bisporus var. bisporus H97]EKV45513.1 hypothetical protein AGABI2DRAFT_119199 [Agaricus bisporus var. bisporus H97]